MYAGAAHADSNEYGYCVSLWNYALKLKLEKETLVSCDTAFTARAIVQLYINIQARYLNNSDPYDENPLKFEDGSKFHYVPNHQGHGHSHVQPKRIPMR